jgi:hypothetical protein
VQVRDAAGVGAYAAGMSTTDAPSSAPARRRRRPVSPGSDDALARVRERHEKELEAATAVAREQKRITEAQERIDAAWLAIARQVQVFRSYGWPAAQIADTLGLSTNRVNELAKEAGSADDANGEGDDTSADDTRSADA